MGARSVIRAFAAGLWLGGFGGALAVWLILRTPASPPVSHPPPASMTSAIAGLEQENARLRAETRRLEETVSELKALLEVLAASPAESASRTSRPAVNQLRWVRRWADALEVDPQAADRLRALFRDGQTDPAVLRAAVEAVARPPTNLAADILARMNLLADFAELPLAQQVEDALVTAQEELAARWLADAGAAD